VIRNDSNATVGDHRHTTAIAYDGFAWHNIVYVQRQVSATDMKAQVWVDGVLDPVVVTPVRPLTAQTTAIGGLLRTSASSWFSGLIDEVAVWDRALSAEEVGILQVTAITNPPIRVQPLTINRFQADRAAVSAGGATTLRWDVSKDVSQVTIDKLGDVTGATSVGIGSTSISPAQATTYVLTIQRGVDSLSATTSVAVVTGVAAGWKVLDNFDQAAPGNLYSSGYWSDTSGNSGSVAPVNGNQALTVNSSGISYLDLHDLAIPENQSCTLFFRMISGAPNAVGVTNIVGLTDKSQRSYGDEFANIGSVLYLAAFTNIDYGVDTNGWYIGARNFFGSPIDFYGSQVEPQKALEAGGVYNIWIDITNAPGLSPDYVSDTFTVYVQKEGGAARTVLFQDFTSDRDLFTPDPVLGGYAPDLDKLVVMVNSATVSAIFDDFYLSTTGYNSTVPIPYSTGVVPPGPLSAVMVGSQLQISWPNGVLQSATSVNGVYQDVPGNPTSPYLVTPTGSGMYFRTRP